MHTNELPAYDMTDNPTGCCPRFNPEGWDDVSLHLKDMPMLRAVTMSAMHIPLNMGKVFNRVQSHIEKAGAFDADHYIVLSRDPSPWYAEHLFAVSKPVPDEEMTKLSGDYITRVFEGPYRDARDWFDEMDKLVRANGDLPGKIWFFYTTCPKCAKTYGKNYVVGVAEVL